MTTVRVAAVQASYELMNREATIDRVADLTAAAATEGAQLRPLVDPSSVAAIVALLRAAETAEAEDPALLGERAAHVGGPGRTSGIPVASLGPRPAAGADGSSEAAVRDLGVGVAAVRESAVFESAHSARACA